VFRGTLLQRQDTCRRQSREPRFMVLGELYGRVVMIISGPRRGEMPYYLVTAGELRGASDIP
jgi:hypothetical protein